MAPTRADDSPVYQLKITVRDSKPQIWRRIQVRGSATLARLHDILQVVMGWTDSHLHQFHLGGVRYSEPDPEEPDPEAKNEGRAKLSQLGLEVKDRFIYEYDFGDSWEHEIVVEKILPPAPDAFYPVCLAGSRACPPEDVGGVLGYAEFLKAIRNPRHEEHEAMLEWVGGEFDPEAFDLEAVNQQLRRRWPGRK